MGLFQPSIPPLQLGIDLAGQTVVITGASSGIGLAVARRILKLRASNLILAVRDVPKGETVKASFLEDAEIQSMNPMANIQVMKLDMETYASPMAFASDFRQRFGELHVLLLNAGGVSHQRELMSTGHEKTVQVNYLSNVLLLLELLPLLESTAHKTGKPSRVTWTGSRSYRQTSLKRNALPESPEGWLNHFDNAGNTPLFNRYADSKLLGLLFLRELANHYNHDKVIINSFCPNTVNTGMASAMPMYLRLPAAVIMKVKGRSPDEATSIVLNAALVAGAETHGALLEDCTVVPVSELVRSDDGGKVQRELWNETVTEMGKYTELPAWMEQII
ncbi:hypothetical protein S7711_08913 [Stachybotrys chartarum IBT 7711]|uniref:Uncharacterized protein n=1 Tax=Stachybotrys chartarum (strain CBS 109288 / IBT 7711) TaxID=1280523 RepID=A0A084B1V4_STACB|nr:hypothetical protein S7711_08913 [Stachybotrys chartarum IBT 7711]KFA45687.1 hypothetical protein S40293_08029 [Stachybotrys chartarum IBT 40293]